MADLLECLIQIKGVADTPRRLALRLAAQAAGGVGGQRGLRIARWMAEAESRFAGCLTLMLSDDRSALAPLPTVRMSATARQSEGEADAAQWLSAFSDRRAQTVALLERCSAEQLGRIGLEPSRGPMTVADLVAVMLAHDTDCLGEIGGTAQPTHEGMTPT